jgi:HK97 family phage prohead protease
MRSNNIERVEFRSIDTALQGNTLSGIAVPYGESSRVLYDRPRPYRERFERNSLAIGDSVSLLLGHDPSTIPLGRVGAGTLRFEDTADGLRFVADLPSSRPEVVVALMRGDLDGSVSIGFITQRDSWGNKTNPALRTVQDATLLELSIVPAGAYAGARGTLTNTDSGENQNG